MGREPKQPSASEGPFYGLEAVPDPPVVRLEDQHGPAVLNLNPHNDVLEAVTAMTMSKALFIDIDDTVRKGYGTTGQWVNKPEDVEVFEHVPELLWAFKKAGYRVLGISNQGGIATRHQTRHSVYSNMRETMRQCEFEGRATFDHIVICPNHPAAKERTEAECFYRKPRPGMVYVALQWVSLQFNEMVVPSQSLFVGDSREDKECAQAVGVRFMDAVDWRSGGAERFLKVKPIGPQVEIPESTPESTPERASVFQKVSVSGTLSVRDSGEGDDQC